MSGRRLASLAMLAALSACGNARTPVPGSTCESNADCDAYPSCAWRVDACECRDQVCYIDPDAPFDEELGCRGCHGSLDNAAPPTDTTGETATTALGVGAHQAHMADGEMSMFLGCDQCHVVPTTVNDEGHIDGDMPAEVVFGPLATNNGAVVATWDRESGTCTTYCHGATLSGGSQTAPSWTLVDGSQAACGTCHGLPPTENHPTSGTCEHCHSPTAGPNHTIANRATHIDGILQLTGGACDGCHGAPPDTGAHAAHDFALGFDCAACHGHNGSGPTHIQDTNVPPVVLRENVDVVFENRTFPGGTTTGNGGIASYDRDSMTCRVGCHNPVPGNPDETPNLSNTVSWTATSIECRSCHDQVGAAPPRNHPIGSPDRTDCKTCHDLSQHMEGQVVLADPDPGDAYVPALGNIEPLCKTCHDGGGGSFFGGQTPRNVLAGWTASAHGQEGMICSDCHTYHVSTNNTSESFVDPSVSGCVSSGCHLDQITAPNGSFTLASHHPLGDDTSSELRCVACHNPHLAKASPDAASDPDDPWTLVSYPTIAASRRRSDGVDTRGFCLACHDGAPPAGVPTSALNIQQALNGGSDPSQFRAENESLHRNQHGGWNCVTCHDWHGAQGTSGINRGRMLQPFITVQSFPYSGEGSCGTPSQASGNLGRFVNGVWVTYSFGCH